MACSAMYWRRILQLLLLGVCVHCSQQQQHVSSSIAWNNPDHVSRQLLQAMQQPGPAAAAAVKQIPQQQGSMADNMAARRNDPTMAQPAAGSMCRITTQNWRSLISKCHSSCHTCSREPSTSSPDTRPCKCWKPGFFLAAGSSSPSCSPCPQGQWGPAYGQTACRKCPRGTVSLSAGSRVCDGE